MNLQNTKAMLEKARKNKYAIPHININNLEWTKAALLGAQAKKSPLIIATSEGALKYMGGLKTVYNLVTNLIEFLEITVPVALHLDHGSFETCKKALETGFTSVMYDGSREEFSKNLELTRQIVELANSKNATVEAEVGQIGGEEDGIIGNGEIADVDQAYEISKTGITCLAAGIGNIHGVYPPSWKSLDFDVLDQISEKTQLPLVLHGGSGLPKDQIQKAIKLGIAKINVNTELQQANAAAVTDFVVSGKIKEGKNFDPRKLLAPGTKAIQELVEAKIVEFGSENQA
ncbi:class II fructose-1,6-bisphosphate aldolase [Mesomycoplasma ovipneumoniae]|uniref:Class II fructose-1,6-bisphosphate aldolase n=1 Tax=Mesomycoplasma ovipneumoniae TaxID=29562 RepID=A0AAJ2P636_9BACT|nr:class II fructose-1,6-bisphosphate aldolase [Mesomycoplasma ovipneumoniae]MDW2829566.1 class II fructose-1,6-bisphosphate aldolase [Mesomycoplasma ovipneumoniae]MDW2870585.1 class II fructose-1,6-bisphosphate aldolase [Mesomycoplasma ovipneumoniae]MDW2892512.1 class II fructose-1,6-bisphosphate aldolase [Mesomycoplasma ovipneumoniae]MDW2893222.1 class II fructose-1,6-bisphosphate aldolase [Mesomycoplasma ovipneumoniae]MDW2908297.1 class II fructose-1,6-bisphosphate aldolase [Mesomycoplasma 